MASITVSREDLFPNGTSVAAYAASGTGRTPSSGAPAGSSVTSGTVSGGSVTLSGLTEETVYILYASSPDRYLRVLVPAPDATGGASLPDASSASADDILTLVDDGDESTAAWLPPPSGTLPTDNTDGQVLGSVGTTATWLDVDTAVTAADIPYPPSGTIAASDVGAAIAEAASDATQKATLTTKGDLYVATASATPARLAVGSDGQVLKAASGQSTGLQWSADTGFANPMTTSGDIIYGGASGAPTRLAKGTDGQVLKLASGLPSWAADATGGGGGANAVHPAAAYGLKTWTHDPLMCDATVSQNGGVLLTGTIVVPYDDNYTGIAIFLTGTVGAGLTVAYGALWDLAGTTQVAKTASQTANWTSTGYKTAAFTGNPIALTAGVYIFGLITTGTTAATFRARAAAETALANAGRSDPSYRAAYLFPADNSTAALTGLTSQDRTPWVGLY